MLEKSKVLIVDDKPENLFALENILSNLDIELIKATNGNDALKETLNHNFALAILDVHMPEMDGYELAELMHNEEKTKHIPYIFLSAVYSDKSHIYKGYKSGAVDFLTKPYDPEILQHKVKVFIELDSKKRELENNKNQLEQLAKDRARQLVHADKMVTLGTLSAGVAHEINNPIGFVSNNLQIFEKLWDLSIRAYLEKVNSENEDKNLSFALEEMPRMLKTMKEGTRRIANIVHSLGRFSRITKLVFEPSNICKVIEGAVRLSKFDLVVKHKVKVQLDLPNDIPNIKISRQEIEQVLINLITNSAYAMEEMGDRKEFILKITVSHVNNNIVITITDNGHGMDEKTLDNIFDPFFTTKEVGKGTGLGLSVCRGIIEQHRGTITATSTLGEETTFTIKLPEDPEIKERRDKNGKKTIGVMRNED